MSPILLVLVFIVSSVVGYFVIKKIPSLLHTPLMSGMNALSGITVVGAIICLLQFADPTEEIRSSVSTGVINTAIIISGIAILLAMVNIVGGFGVTERMLRMFKSKKDKKKGGKA
ncbi:NAD(P) transhydrogenase subunit alpha [Porphyromonas somerae]|uniref:NAD(P) transhydrogenase subunit alpha n=1 Tax=Porphyromonas somerae TaxID=322095 RepID=UPI002A754F80|nr:NAD(P) transhydrogenase subunit alpha [Porphyromonas somerae]MDY3120096.1 NAD(P) transhydrogenase subunit alpha [Porphyromonas somerae]MDY3885438.1 NAD(P) transhydrogenase subunit alpha [Porphyromonas somerae]